MLSTLAADDLYFEFLGLNEALRWSWISIRIGLPRPLHTIFFDPMWTAGFMPRRPTFTFTFPAFLSSHARKSWKSASLCTHEKRESLSAKGRLSHTAELLKMIHDSRIKARESRSCPNGYEDCCARLTWNDSRNVRWHVLFACELYDSIFVIANDTFHNTEIVFLRVNQHSYNRDNIDNAVKVLIHKCKRVVWIHSMWSCNVPGFLSL